MSQRITDERLIAACQQGDREAFRLLFDAYKDRVYSIALYCLHGNETAAEDVTQEVFVRLFTRIQQFRSRSEFATWLYRLVVNCCQDEYRRRRRCVSLQEVETSGSNLPAASWTDDYDRFELQDSIRQALEDLHPEIRAAVVLKYFDELSYDDMAHVLDCSKGTVASRLHRGLKTLARKLAHLRDPVSSESG